MAMQNFSMITPKKKKKKKKKKKIKTSIPCEENKRTERPANK